MSDEIVINRIKNIVKAALNVSDLKSHLLAPGLIELIPNYFIDQLEKYVVFAFDNQNDFFDKFSHFDNRVYELQQFHMSKNKIHIVAVHPVHGRSHGYIKTSEFLDWYEEMNNGN